MDNDDPCKDEKHTGQRLLQQHRLLGDIAVEPVGVAYEFIDVKTVFGASRYHALALNLFALLLDD